MLPYNLAEFDMTIKPAKRIRVLLADDHPAIVEDLRAVLQAEFEVVATVGDGLSLIAAAETVAHDVIVTDIAMPGADGIAAAAEILQRNPNARIVFVTVHSDPAMLQKAFATGALGYVLKLAAGDELGTAIHAAMGGKRHVSSRFRGLMGANEK
jgi:DNA-binding NarL/FixJ family response regulator